MTGMFLNSCREGNVLIYKKPAFWIVIATAVICTGIFVICTTNPKTYYTANASRETAGVEQQMYEKRPEYEGSNGGEAPVPEYASYSPDHNWAVWSDVRENLKDESGLFYSIYQVMLCNTQTGTITVFDIIGRDFNFLWSEDCRFLAVTYSGREWTHFSIVNTTTLTEIPGPYMASVMEQLKARGATFDYTANETRPDPALTPVEWLPDSSSILIYYQWHDTSYTTQSGTFVYEIESGQISELIQNPPRVLPLVGN